MIRTLAVGSDARQELECRLRFLKDVEMPLLSSEWGEPGYLGSAALRVYSEREIQDVTRLLGELSEPLQAVSPGESVRLNDCVELIDQTTHSAEEFVVHAPELIVRAAGYISADSALGAAVLGRQIGDLVRVKTPGGVRSYLLRGIRRSCS
jgi:transcription elongation GreA/GreB family factor